MNEIRNETKKLDATKTDHCLTLIWFISVFICTEANKHYEPSPRPGRWGCRRIPLLEFLPPLIATVNLTANCDRNEEVFSTLPKPSCQHNHQCDYSCSCCRREVSCVNFNEEVNDKLADCVFCRLMSYRSRHPATQSCPA